MRGGAHSLHCIAAMQVFFLFLQVNAVNAFSVSSSQAPSEPRDALSPFLIVLLSHCSVCRYAFSISSSQAPSGPIRYELVKEMMLQPPWDTSLQCKEVGGLIE